MAVRRRQKPRVSVTGTINAFSGQAWPIRAHFVSEAGYVRCSGATAPIRLSAIAKPITSD